MRKAQNIAQAETITDTPVYRRMAFWSILIPVIGTIISGYMLYLSKTVEINSREKAQESIASQQHVMDLIQSLQQQVAQQGEEIKTLKADADRWRNLYISELLDGVDKEITVKQLANDLKQIVNESEVRLSFIKRMPLAGWIKCKDEFGIYKFKVINDQFKVKLGFGEEVIGLSDYDIFPNTPDLAEQYQEGDSLVGETGRSIKDTLNVPDATGELSPTEYIKFNMNMPEPDVCVGGMLIK